MKFTVNKQQKSNCSRKRHCIPPYTTTSLIGDDNLSLDRVQSVNCRFYCRFLAARCFFVSDTTPSFVGTSSLKHTFPLMMARSVCWSCARPQDRPDARADIHTNGTLFSPKQSLFALCRDAIRLSLDIMAHYLHGLNQLRSEPEKQINMQRSPFTLRNEFGDVLFLPLR